LVLGHIHSTPPPLSPWPCRQSESPLAAQCSQVIALQILMLSNQIDIMFWTIIECKLQFNLMSSGILVGALVPIISVTLDLTFVFFHWRWIRMETSWNNALFICNRNLIFHVFMSGNNFSFYVPVADAELITASNGFRRCTALMPILISGEFRSFLFHLLSNWLDFRQSCQHGVTCFTKQCSTQSYSFV